MLEILTAVALAATAPASTAPPPPLSLGGAGQLVTSTGLAFSGDYQGYTTGEKFYGVSLSPTLDWFVRKNLSIGIALSLSYSGANYPASPSENDNEYGVGVGPRIGYLISIGNGFSFWPRLTISVGYTSDRFESGNADFVTMTRNLSAPFVYQVAPHLFLGLGPFAESVSHLGVGGNFGAPLGFLEVGFSSYVGGYF